MAVTLFLALALSVPAAAAGERAPQRPPVVVKVDRGGFHWLDAAVGAVGGIAAVLLVYGLALGARPRGGR